MSNPMRSTRRQFLCSAAAAGWASPNDRVNIGLIGSGGRGAFEAGQLTRLGNCEIVAVCDPQETRRLAARAAFEKLYAQHRPGGGRRGIRVYNDFRDLLAQRDIDAVYIATPDHWHVPITIAAMKAGKDCHTEKPLGISVEEDLAALKAARKYGRVFQYGTERRSTPEARHAIELVLNGRIGKVRKIYVVSPGSETGGSATPALPVPKGFDYDLWLGPAPEAPFSKDRCLGQGQRNGIFHIRDYSIGFIAGWAAHPLDQVQWWADHSGLTIPVAYEGAGKLPDEGLFNCAYQWDIRCTYQNGLVLHMADDQTYRNFADAPHPNLGRSGAGAVHNAAIFVGSEGWVSVAYEKVVTHPASLISSEVGQEGIHLPRSPIDERLLPPVTNGSYNAAAHHFGWVEAIRSRKQPVSPIESAVHSDLVSQLCDICIRSGQSIRWDPAGQTVRGGESARKMMSRPMRKPWTLA